MKSPIYTKNVPAPGVGSTIIPVELMRRNIINMFIDNHLKCDKIVLYKQTSVQFEIYCRNNTNNVQTFFDKITINR